MKSYLLALLLFLIASSATAQHRYTEKQVTAYAKSTDVKILDPSLASQRLEDWLQSGPPHAHIVYWKMEATCDLMPGSSAEDYPLCARIGFSRNDRGGFILVQVGTRRRGIVGRPQLFGDIGVWKADQKEGWVLAGTAERLSDLPALLD